jgi:hypothetical protein
MFCQTLRRNILLSTTVRCFTSTTKTSSVSPPVLVERSGEIATIIINKLDLKNAVDLDTANALADALRERRCSSRFELSKPSQLSPVMMLLVD